jgi:hypothetical protein
MSLQVIDRKKTTEVLQDLVAQPDFFCSDLWSSCYDDRFRIFFILDEKKNIVGKFAAFEGGKKNLKTLITAPFSPHIGLCVAETKNNPVKIQTFHKQIAQAIASFLLESKYVYYKLDFPCGWTDMQPLLWQKLNPVVRYTYRLDLTHPVEHIESNLDSSRRNKINKARREELVISHEPNAHNAMHMIRENLKGKPVALHEKIMRKILDLLSSRDAGFYTTVKQQDTDLAMTICCHNGETSYNLFSAINRKIGNNAAGSLCLFESILLAKKSGQKIFDFEGSVVPEIEEYFRTFGGELTPYYSVQGGKWPWPQIIKWRQKRRPA